MRDITIYTKFINTALGKSDADANRMADIAIKIREISEEYWEELLNWLLAVDFQGFSPFIFFYFFFFLITPTVGGYCINIAPPLAKVRCWSKAKMWRQVWKIKTRKCKERRAPTVWLWREVVSQFTSLLWQLDKCARLIKPTRWSCSSNSMGQFNKKEIYVLKLGGWKGHEVALVTFPVDKCANKVGFNNIHCPMWMQEGKKCF